MKKIFTPIVLLALLFGYKAQAGPVSGTVIVPGPSFGSLKQLIDTLNFWGVTGAGPVTVDLRANETAPSGGYILGSSTLNTGANSTNSTRTLTFKGNSHILTANSGTGNNDAIFTIQGTDYVTINSMNLAESASNTTATSMMEHGYAIVKLSSSDACKTLSITNSKIVMNNTNTTAATGVSHVGSAGIFIGNCTATSTAALGAPPVYEGSHEGFYIANDSILNVTSGVYGNGTGVVIDGIAFNDLSMTIQNNVISNFTTYGIFLVFFNNDLVQGNQINNMWNGGAAATNTIFGVVYNGSTATATNNSWSCQKNNIDLTIGGTSAIAGIGVYSQIYGTGSTTISEDTIKITSTGAAALSQLVGIYQRNMNGTSVIDKNVLHDFSIASTVNTSLTSVGIWNGQTSSGTGLLLAYPASSKITNNTIRNFSFATVGSFYGCLDQNVITSGTPSTTPAIFTGNTMTDIVITGTTAASTLRGYLFRTSLATSLTCTGNTFKNISVVNNATPVIVIDPAAYTLVVGDLSNNRIQNVAVGAGALTGVVLDYGKSMTMNSDTMINLSGAADVIAYKAGFGAQAVVTQTFNKNLLDSLSSTGTSNTLAAISMTSGSANVTTGFSFTNGVIRRLNASGTTATAHGILTAGSGTTFNISNNMITGIRDTNNVTAYCSSFGLNLANTGTYNVYYNTINMSVTSLGNAYGSTGLLFNPSATNTIKNNILRVNVLAGAANNVAAIRSSSGSASASPAVSAFTTSSNIYYAPTGPNNFLYVAGTTNTSLVNGYHQSGLTPSTTKNIVNDTFFNSECGKSSYHNFMQTGASGREKNTFTENNLSGSGGIFAPTGMSYAESGATDVPVSTDLKGDPRPTGTADIGAYQFTGTIRPAMLITITSATGFDTACTYNLPKLTATIPIYFKNVSYQWYRDTTKIPGATSTSLTVTAVSGNYILKVYDSLTGCLYASNPYKMTIVPPPPAMILYYDSLTFCESSAIVLQANKGKGFVYRWMRNGSFLSGETTDHLVVNKSGDYNVEVNTPLGCPTLSTSIRVKVYPLPKPVIYYVRDRTLGVTKKFFTYQWYRNNVKIADTNAIAPTFYTFLDGAYTVEVTDSNGCTAKSDVFLYSLGIDNQTVAATVKIYPNPATSVLHIESPIAIDAQITDLAGRTLINKTNAKDIDIAHLADGMYMLTLTDKEGKLIKVEKINKMK